MTEELMEVTTDTTELVSAQSTTVNIMASFDLTTDEGRAKAYNAGIAADEKIEDHIGETIGMVDFYIEPINAVNDATGEMETRAHSVIFASDGRTYESQSKGILSSLSRLDSLYNFAERTEPLPITFAERKAKLGRMYIIKLA